MGNSTSEIVSRVSGMSIEQLEKQLKQDLELLNDPGMVFSSTKLALRGDLSGYSVSSSPVKPLKSEPVPTDDEESLVCSQDFLEAARDRHSQVLSNLMSDISKNTELDIASTEITKRLQAFCRVFEAVLRFDQLKQLQAKESKNARESKGSLPASAKAAIRFGLSTLLNLIHCVATLNPALYEMVLVDADSILAEMPPLSMQTSDPTLLQSFTEISDFFDGVISGKIPEISRDVAAKSFIPFFRLAESTGSLVSFLTIALRLLTIGKSENLLATSMLPSLRDFQKLQASLNVFAWDTLKKHETLTVLQDTVSQSPDTDCGNCFLASKFNSDQLYFEILVNRVCENSYFGICDAKYTSTTAWNDSSYYSVMYNSNSSVFIKANESFKFEPWAMNDRIGIFLDMNKKRISFYRNGVKHSQESLNITSDEVKVFICLSKDVSVTLCRDSKYPADIQSLLVKSEASVSHFEKLLSEETPDEIFASLPLGEITTFILTKLEACTLPIEYLILSKKFKFTTKTPAFGVEVCKKTVEILLSLQQTLNSKMLHKDYSSMSEESLVLSIAAVEKLITLHLLVNDDLCDASITTELKKAILDETLAFATAVPEGKHSEAATVLVSQCFEVFYKEPEAKLKYIVEGLERGSGVETLKIVKQMEGKIFLEMSRPDKVFPALQNLNEEYLVFVKKFYRLLIDASAAVSHDILQGKPTDSSSVRLLETVQIAMFAQAAKVEFKGSWSSVISDYSSYYLNSCISILQSNTLLYDSELKPEMLLKINETLMSNLLDELLNSLVLSSMELSLIAELLPLVTEIAHWFSKISTAPSVLSLGIGLVEEVYESPHNYLDNSQLTHLIKVPSAIKYTLVFDPQCKTENGCDYLQLFLDEAGTSLFARYEGENFPKEPVEVINPLLYFTFRSDGSVNYWGWKIDIKASVESSYYKKQWPETSKDTIELFFGLCSCKLVNSKFDTVETPEEVVKALDNPFLKHGVYDRCLLSVRPLTKINPDIMKIVEHTLADKETFIPESLRSRAISTNFEIGLQGYLKNYEGITETTYADSVFLQGLIEGKEELVEAWKQLKKKSVVAGGGMNIGGTELDQAERAVFSVYTAFFEIVETMSAIFTNVNEAGQTVKLFVKESCNIRSWAQKQKQKLIDAGNAEASYQLVNDDIVKKCTLLLGCQYKLCLQELGISKVMKNLMSNIAKVQEKKGGLKLGSKWKSVQDAMKSVTKLKALSAIKKKSGKPENEDNKEFARVSELVKQFLESPVTIEKIADALESRRIKAIARATGFLSISKIISFSKVKLETVIVKSFSDSMKKGEKKVHYSEGIQGVDPYLTVCVQRAFFSVIRSLQQEIITSGNTEHDFETYSHFSTTVEAMSFHLQGVDTHMLLDQPLSATLKVLLSWAKGDIKEKPLKGSFLKEKCITRFSLATADTIAEGKPKIVIEKREDQPSLCLSYDIGGNELPITGFEVVEEQKESGEDAVGEFMHNGTRKWIYIKREEPDLLYSYLTEVSEELVPKFQKYAELLGPINIEEKKKLTKLRESLARNSWNLYKQLLFAALGAWQGSNESQQLQVQEQFLKVIFSELSSVNTEGGKGQISLKLLSTGSPWVGKPLALRNKAVTKMEYWLSKFYQDNQNELAELVQGYIEAVDNLKEGRVAEVSSPQLQDLLVHCRNEAGEYDFFKYLESIKACENLPEDIAAYLSSSPLWNNWSEEPPYSDPLNLPELLSVLKQEFRPAEENSFARYLDLFTDTTGLVAKEQLGEAPIAEFLLEDGQLDLFKTLTEIRDNPKHSGYLAQLKSFYEVYPIIPSTVAGIETHREASRGYAGSLLWTLYGGFTSTCLGHALSKGEYIRPLLHFAFKSESTTIGTLASRLLSRILPSQHSPQSFAHIWQEVFTAEEDSDIVSMLLRKIGKSVWVWDDKRLGHEIKNLLLALLTADRWKEHVTSTVLSVLEESVEYLSSCKILKAAHAGAISLLSTSESAALSPFVLALVGLRNTAFARGVIKEVIDERTFSVHSALDDTTAKVDLSNIVSIEAPAAANLFKLLHAEMPRFAELMIQIWILLDNSFGKALDTDLEMLTIVPTLYLTLQSTALRIITSIAANRELDPKIFVEIASKLLNKKQRSLYFTSTAYSKIVKEIQDKVGKLNTDPEKLKAEEITEKINQLSDENKVIAAQLQSEGVSPEWTLICVNKGIKDFEGYRTYLDEVPTSQLYKLSQIDENSMKITENSLTAEVYQNNMYQLVISDIENSLKRVTFAVPSNIFTSLKYFTTSVTIRLAVEAVALEGHTKFGVSFGDIEIVIENGLVKVAGEDLCRVGEEPLVFRVHACVSGKVEVSLENTQASLNVFSRSVFNGVRVGDIGLQLEVGLQAHLLMLEVHDGRIPSEFTSKYEKFSKSEGSERFVRIKIKSPNVDKMRLGLLGINEEQAETALANTKDLTEAVSYSLQNYTPTSYSLSESGECILELKVFDTLELVPADFHQIKFFEHFKEIQLTLENRKVLAYKKGHVVKDIKALTGFSITDSAIGETIGDLTIGTEDRSNAIYVKLSAVSAREPGLKDIIYIKSSSANNVAVPLNYTIVTDKEGKAVNIAPKQEKHYYVFIAISKITAIKNIQIYPLESTVSKGTSFGLLEASSSSAVRKEKDQDYSSLSLIELFSLLQDYEDYSRVSLSKDFFSAMFKKYPDLVLEVSHHCSITKIFEYLDPSISESLGSLLHHKDFLASLISGCLASLTSSLISVSGGKMLKSVLVESTHPYDNNMDVDDVISIPGAKGLRIEFDPQCYTESGCDPLRFYEGPGRSGEIKCFSGQGEATWQAFDVPGDTVYTYFHSDGSVNYWGYKFEVIPQGASGSGGVVNTELVLELLKVVARHASSQEIVTSERFLVPVFVYLLGVPGIDDKAKVLEIIKLGFGGHCGAAHDTVIKALAEAAGKLYETTKGDKTSHCLLQGIVQLLCQVKKHVSLGIKDPWFLDLSDLLSDMSGVACKDSAFDMFLFENYKGTAASKLEMDFESEHPYSINTSTRRIYIPGAHSLNLQFSEDSRAEKRHTVCFSSDPEGKSDVEGALQSIANVKWEHKGADVVFDQDDKRVTRTNSSGWGVAVVGCKCTAGVTSVTFLVEDCDTSEYLYLGFIETDPNNAYDLATVLSSDYPKRVWTWRKSGERHVKGSSTPGEGFGKGDIIKFVVNTFNKTIVAYKNNKECFSFSDVAASLVPAACFGGSTQFVVLTSVEALPSSDISSKRLSIEGDSAYLSFPVNFGFKSQFTWAYDNNENGKLAEDRLTFAKLGESPVVLPAFPQIGFGRHYLQTKVLTPGKIAVGVSTTAAITEKTLESESHILFVSDNAEVSTFGEGDTVGILLEVEENSIGFYKNDVLVQTVSGRLVPGEYYGFLAIVYEVNSEISIVKGLPEHLDLWRVTSDQVSAEYGYKLKVVPELKGRSLGAMHMFLESNSKEFREDWESYKDTFGALFKSAAAEELVIYLDQFCPTKSKHPLELTKEDLVPSKADLIYYPELEKLAEKPDVIFKLYQILQSFNKRLEGALYMFDLHFAHELTDLQRALVGCRNFIFFRIKNDLLSKTLEKTKNDVRTEINIDRPKAARYRLRKEVDSEGQFSIYGQIYRAMSAVGNNGYRNAERIYKINYRGEASIDAGGPYNESMSNICDELQSTFLRLLVPSQNNTHNMGENRDAWVLNPSASSETDLELYRFLGKLMGAAIRTQNNLNLSLPPLFWKKILREPVNVKDLRGMDACTVQILEILQNPVANELTSENFATVYEETFTTKDSSGKDVEVVEGGRGIPVTFENCAEYAELVVKKRLSESTAAYNRIREGMSVTVPIDYLNLLSFRQLETLVCGAITVDVEILKENTDYEGCAVTDQHIVFFWEILGEFSAKERALYLKFVWGRSRLPSGKDWRHMKITRSNPAGPVNNYMPVSHTCFFTLDLPAYTNKNALKQKLLYAITHCTAIDLDGSAGAGWEDND